MASDDAFDVPGQVRVAQRVALQVNRPVLMTASVFDVGERGEHDGEPLDVAVALEDLPAAVEQRESLIDEAELDQRRVVGGLDAGEELSCASCPRADLSSSASRSSAYSH